MADSDDTLIPIRGITLAIDEAAVRVTSNAPLDALSSAIVGGDLRAARHIVNMHVPKGYDCARPEDDLATFAARLGIVEPFVGMMTAARTHNARVAAETHDGITAVAIVTAGLSNLVAAGVSSLAPVSVGTINTILLLDATLTPAAMVNAVITATEAKTLTLVEHNARTPEGHLSSGTSTDAIVVACTGRGAPLRYAGPATVVGWLIARTVQRALSEIIGRG